MSKEASQFVRFECNRNARFRALLGKPPAVEWRRSADHGVHV